MATKLKDLIEAGLLKVDEPIQIYFRTGNRRYDAVILSNGHIKTEPAKTYSSPSGAAREYNGNKPIDGWLKWRVIRLDMTLSELRDKHTT
jgi:hypothetical protein